MNLTRFLSRAAVAALVFTGLTLPSARAILDLNGDGVPDIWAMAYNAAGLQLDRDTDGDGQTNGQEAVAGTDPRSPAAFIKISNLTIDGGGVHVIFPSQAGKRYQLQRAVAVGALWTNVGAPMLGSGSDMTQTDAAGVGGNRFYRVTATDTDSDGDGVNDWEELQVGFDPNDAHSNGLGGPNDLAALTAALGATNVITVTASSASVTEPTVVGGSGATGTITIRRSGNVNPLTVNYSVGGSAIPGSDYVALSGTVTLPIGVNTALLTVTPLFDSAVESPEAVLVTATSGAGYSLGSPSIAAVLITDYSTPTGNGVAVRYWNNTAATIPVFTNTVATATVPIGPNAALTRIESQINNAFGTLSPSSPGTQVNADYFVGRYTADLLPEFSQVYTFTSVVDRGCRLYVNGTLIFSRWGNDPGAGTATLTGTAELQAGQRVPIVYEYMARSNNAQNNLRWTSANRPDEVIPQNRLFASAPPQILNATTVLLIANSPPFTFQIQASGEPTSYGAANLPPGWTINTATGLISGTPSTAGTWEIPLTATNASGSGSAILTVQVIATGSAITRDVWAGVPGTAVSAIPLGTAPTSTGNITLLEGPQDVADDYGARIRGYITAPTSGLYKFWLTASNSAELYIADDDEPVNAFLRAQVTAPTLPRQWSSPNAGKSPLLLLEQGRRYYVEVRHKAGVGSDHVSVGWLKPNAALVDPGSVAAPDEVVPTYALSPYVPPTASGPESALYTTSLTAQGGAVTSGFGSASLRLSADETEAILAFNYANLSTAVSAKHVHSDAHGGAIIFDIDVEQPAQDGSYTWEIVGVGAISAADIINVIKTGQAYLNVHTANYPAGEIRGNFRLQAASQTFTPPAAPPAWTDDHTDRNAASRFLVQTTFGPSPNDLSAANPNSVLNLGYSGWIDYQASLLPTDLYPVVYGNRNQTDGGNQPFNGTILYNAWWQNSITAPDQLRQRVAFALSEILVVSEEGPLDERGDAVSSYYDVLLTHAFGNFRDLLEAVTLHPAMGRYLDMLRNDKPDLTTGRIPNENYAREIKQLFSIGLNRLHPDGSLILNSKGEVIPTYDQNAIIGFAHVFTGWDYFYTGAYRTTLGAGANWLQPMREVPARHFTGRKLLLNNVVLPGMATFNGQPLNPYADPTQISGLTANAQFQGLASTELDIAHDALFNHPNCAPFICRQLIQRLVTSTPSRGYLYRVVSAFNDNGSGVRGDMKAVIKAILLDYEARSPALLVQQGYGKQREAVNRVTAIARGFPAPASVAGTYSQTGSLITVNTAPVNHLYANGDSVPLEFSEAVSGDPGSPLDATYTIGNVTPQSFTVRVRSFEGPVAYEQNGAATRFTTAGNGFYPNVGDSVYVEYVDGTPPPAPTSGIDVVDYRSGNPYYNIYLGVPGAKRATYSQAVGGSNLVVTSNAHGYLVGANVHISFVSGTGVSGVFAITAVSTNTFTVTAADALARSGSAIVVEAALALPLVTGNANVTRVSAGSEFANRTGTAVVSYSDWNIASTNTDLNMTPLRSPTVFNFFLPDYQFPGILGNAGLITPEFELTSETSVIRQANFIYGGLYNTTLGQTGLESFRGGGRDIMVDLRPWLGTGPGGLPWAHNNNVNAFIDELNTLLMGGQLPSAARTIIRNHVQSLAYGTTRNIETIAVSNPAGAPCELRITGHGLTAGQTITISGVSGGTFSPSINGTFQVTAINSANRFTVPVSCSSITGLNLSGATMSIAATTSQLRDRVRAAVHLIVTSPDFTIQK